MRCYRIKSLLIVMLCGACMFSGCSNEISKEVSDLNDYVMNNEEKLIHISEMCEKQLLCNEEIVYSEDKFYLNRGDEDVTELNENDKTYAEIIDFLKKDSFTYIVQKNSNGIMFAGSDDRLIMNSTKKFEQLEFSYFDDSLAWEKRVDGNKIEFISDHRKDKTSMHKRMYYKATLEKASDGFFVGVVETKYPWYAYFELQL